MASTPELDRMVALRDQGMTQGAIGKEIGKSRSYVQKVLADHRRGVVEDRPRPHVGQFLRVAGSATPWDRADGSAIGEASGQVLPPPDNVGEWNSFGLEADTWKALGKNMTLPVLSNVSPGISRAIWDYLRMLDPGHTIDFFRPGTETEYPQAKAAGNEFIATRIEPRYTTIKGMFQQMNMGALYRGAFCAQLVTDEAARMPIEVIVPDPIVIQFKPVESERIGLYWEPGIVVSGNWQSVASPFFHYVAVDSLPGQPYGRSMIAPATFASIFIIGLLYDLRRVVAQQGYPRTNIKVIVDKLRPLYEDLKLEDFRAIVEELVQQVGGYHGQLQPDDAFIFTDAVDVKNGGGAVDSGVIGGATGLIESLQRMEIQALKTMPLMMGMTDGVSEANANRQWEIFVAGIKAMQHSCETVTQNILKMALRIQGIQADVRVKFAEVRSAEVLRDEEAKRITMENNAFARDQGWISDDEAAEASVGHKPTGIKLEPKEEELGATGDPVPDSERAVRRLRRDLNDPADDEAQMREALKTWAEQFADDPEATLLAAEVD